MNLTSIKLEGKELCGSLCGSCILNLYFIGGQWSLHACTSPPRPASGQVAVTTGTQVRLPLLRDGFWQLHLHPGQLPAKPAQGSLGGGADGSMASLSAACPPLCSPTAWLTRTGPQVHLLGPWPQHQPPAGPRCPPRPGQLLDARPLSTERPSTRTRWSWLPAATTSGARVPGWSGAPPRPRGTIPGLCLQLHPAQDGFEGKEAEVCPSLGLERSQMSSKPAGFSRFAACSTRGHGADKLSMPGGRGGARQAASALRRRQGAVGFSFCL